MKKKFIIKFFILLIILILLSPVCLSSIKNNNKSKIIKSNHINNLIIEQYKLDLKNQDNISINIQILDENEVWHDTNITVFNNSILEFKVELRTTRGYQFLAAALSLPYTDNGLLFYIYNNSFQCSKKPTFTDITDRDIILLWLPILLPTTITFNVKVKVQNSGINKEVLGSVIGAIDYELFDIVNDSLYITSIPSPLPNKPDQPKGTTTGLPDIIYNYSTKTIDPDGDQVYYKWDWGDQIISDWEGPYNSGEEINSSHIWSSRGYYNIRVKARDEYWHESEWSNPLSVTMSKTKMFNQLPKIILWLFERFSFLQ